MLQVGITVAPRTVSYLESTLIALSEGAKAGVDIELVLAPTTPEDSATCERFGSDLFDRCGRTVRYDVLAPLSSAVDQFKIQRQGLEINTDRLIEQLLLRGGDGFLTLQDDIDFCSQSIERICQVKYILNEDIKDPGFISFYTQQVEAKDSKSALWEYNRYFYGELALLWSRKFALHFLQENTSYAMPHDLAIQRFTVNHPHYACFSHSPCLVQHLGEVSSAGRSNDKRRVSPYFVKSHLAVAEGKLFAVEEYKLRPGAPRHRVVK